METQLQNTITLRKASLKSHAQVLFHLVLLNIFSANWAVHYFVFQESDEPSSQRAELEKMITSEENGNHLCADCKTKGKSS